VKVEEVKPVPGVAKKIDIEEETDSDDEDEAAKIVAEKLKSKTKSIDKSTLDGAKAKAAEIDKN